MFSILLRCFAAYQNLHLVMKERSILSRSSTKWCLSFSYEVVLPNEVESQLSKVFSMILPNYIDFLHERKVLLHMGEVDSSTSTYMY